MNIFTELKNELGYTNVTNQYIELSARMFQMDHKNDELRECARKVNLSIAALPESYLKRIANGYIIGVHSCVEHFLVNYRTLAGNPTQGYNYRAENDDNRLKWTLKICYKNQIPQDVKQLYCICNYYRLVRNEIIHSGDGRAELRHAKSELNNIDGALMISRISGQLKAPNDFTALDFDDQVLFSRATRTICNRIYRDSQYDWDTVLEYYKDTIANFLLANDSNGKKKARIINFLSHIYPINPENPTLALIDSIHRFVI